MEDGWDAQLEKKTFNSKQGDEIDEIESNVQMHYCITGSCHLTTHLYLSSFLDSKIKMMDRQLETRLIKAHPSIINIKMTIEFRRDLFIRGVPVTCRTRIIPGRTYIAYEICFDQSALSTPLVGVNVI